MMINVTLLNNSILSDFDSSNHRDKKELCMRLGIDTKEIDEHANDFWLHEIGPISPCDKYNTKLVYRKAEEFWAKEARLLLIQKLGLKTE